ncbi:MAG: hypothetical protein AAFZ63_27845 [Bacteroidota bacterium]
MKLLDTILGIYYGLPRFGIYGKIGKAIDRVMDIYMARPLLETFVRPRLAQQLESGEIGINTETRETPYIVSLTSFPARVEEAWVSIECLLSQTVKPDKIILWLAEEQFPGRKIPETLQMQQKRGLTIEFCDDIKSHKKYYYTMLRHPNACVIAVDDDLYYNSTTMENVIGLHKKHPECIAANRAHEVLFDADGTMRPYTKWKHNSVAKDPSFLLFHTSGHGTLFPPGALIDVAFDKELIKSLSFRSDDVWLKAMTVLSGRKIVTNGTYNKDYCTVGSTQKESLVSSNTKKGAKDKILRKVFKHFDIDLYRYVKQ